MTAGVVVLKEQEEAENQKRLLFQGTHGEVSDPAQQKTTESYFIIPLSYSHHYKGPIGSLVVTYSPISL